jgi:hypothetical protein
MKKKPADSEKPDSLPDQEYRTAIWKARLYSWDEQTRDNTVFEFRELDLRAAMPPGEQNPFDALAAVQLACRLGLPAPPWAARLFDRCLTRRLEESGVTLDHLFGYTQSGKGGHKRALAFRQLLKRRNEMLALNVFGLMAFGLKKDDAIRKVAAKLLVMKGWNTTVYPIELGRDSRQRTPEERREATEQAIRRIYKRWRPKTRDGKKYLLSTPPLPLPPVLSSSTRAFKNRS